jgi:peroxiredoxin
MKTIFPYLFIIFNILTFSSCSEVDEELVKNNTTVSGTIIGGEGKTILLLSMNPEGRQKEISKTVIDAKGNFSLEGNIEYFDVYQLAFEKEQKVLEIVLAPKDNLKINSTFDKFEISPEISGVSWAKQASVFYKLNNDFISKQSSFQKENPKASQVETDVFRKSVLEELDSNVVELVKGNPESDFNLVLFSFLAPIQSFEEWNPENLVIMKQVVAYLKNKYPESPRVLMIEKQTSQIEAISQRETMMKDGKLDAPDFTVKTPDGNDIKLSSLKGQYVLLDFWASWCGPCRKESPNVVKMFNKYKDQGFTVFSVSLDDNADKWKDAIQKDGLVWPNHGSDLQGWKTPLTQLYQFNSIPHTVLINKEGKIIGIGLRGMSLENKLQEIFSNEK